MEYQNNMNILIGIYAVVNIIYCVTTLKKLAKITLEEKTSVDITAVSLLLFLAVFELIRLSIN